jgi:hypothetical protein
VACTRGEERGKGPGLVHYAEEKGRGGGGSVARRTPERGPQRLAMVGHGGGRSRSVRQVTGGGPVRGHRCTGQPEKEKGKMGSAQ